MLIMIVFINTVISFIVTIIVIKIILFTLTRQELSKYQTTQPKDTRNDRERDT